MPGTLYPTVNWFRLTQLGLLLGLAALSGRATIAEDAQRWFQVEITIFSNEAPVDRDAEQWQANRLELAYPDKLRRLHQLKDLLLIDDLIVDSVPDNELGSLPADLAPGLEKDSSDPAPRVPMQASAPHPAKPATEFKFYDFQRDAFLQLPPAESDFQQTNRALERSADHRLMFHGLWRQAVLSEAEAIPIYIEGGLQYGEQHELQGSITIRFNANRDRVVVDTDLWLTEFSVVNPLDDAWTLPPVPDKFSHSNAIPRGAEPRPVYFINRIFQLKQSRDMRSTEFHYLDHPAMGLVILVEPYTVPPMPPPEFDFEENQ